MRTRRVPTAAGMTTPAKENRLTPYQATELAGDLLRQLAEQIGDETAIARTMRHWQKVLGSYRFGVVCMASIRIAFRDRMSRTPITDVPPGAVAFTKENAT